MTQMLIVQVGILNSTDSPKFDAIPMTEIETIFRIKKKSGMIQQNRNELWTFLQGFIKCTCNDGSL